MEDYEEQPDFYILKKPLDDELWCGLHCWVKHDDGTIYDRWFPQYLVFRYESNSWGLVQYSELKGLNRAEIFSRMCGSVTEAFHDKEFLGELRKWEPKVEHSFLNALSYHLKHPNTTRISVGKLGFKCGDGRINWMFG